MKTGPLKFAPEGAIVTFGHYGSRQGPIAITLRCFNGEPYGTASVNVEPYGAPPASPTQVYLKTWAENEGLAEALEAAGVLKRTGVKFKTSGLVEAELAELSPAAIAEIEALTKGGKL